MGLGATQVGESDPLRININTLIANRGALANGGLVQDANRLKRGGAEIVEEDYQDNFCILSASALKFLQRRKIERRKMEEDK